MSDGANKLFKKDPLAFLQNNVILMREGGMPAVAGCYKVNLRSGAPNEVRDHDDTPLTVWIPYLAQEDPHKTKFEDEGEDDHPTIQRMTLGGKSDSFWSNQFKAFYIPWGPNATHVLDLDRSARFLFTPGLTGCSFAATGGPNPRAGHFNYLRSGTDKVSKTATKKAVRTEFGGQQGVSIKRSDYIQAEGEKQRYVFIVGWRRNGAWRYFRQHLEYAGAGKGVIYKRLSAPSEIDNVHTFGSV